MKQVAAILEDKFEDVEYNEPAKAFENHGYEVITLGLEAGKVVKGKKEGTEVEIDLGLNEAEVEDFDGLLIPGGYSPDKLRAHKGPVEFVRKFVLTGKPVFTICHGPQLLISADVIKNIEMTGYKSIKQDIINAGAEFADEKVVIDSNIVSSRNPDDLPAFIEASLAKLEEE